MKYRNPGEYSDWWLIQNQEGGAYIPADCLEFATRLRMFESKIPVPEAVLRVLPKQDLFVWKRSLRLTNCGHWRSKLRTIWQRWFHAPHYPTPAGVTGDELRR